MDVFALRDLLLATQLNNPQLSLVAGHFRYCETFHRPFLNRCSAFTVLREPVDRFLSLYYYNSFKSTSYGKETLPLDVYLTKPRARRSAEDYVRLFRGTNVEHGTFASTDDIEAAKRNLQQFAIVGCLENMSAFEAMFRQRTGLDLNMPVLNKSPAPLEERYAELPVELMQEISQLCEPSTQVYDFVSKHLATASVSSSAIAA